jgi:hypothetical protein
MAVSFLETIPSAGSRREAIDTPFIIPLIRPTCC